MSNFLRATTLLQIAGPKTFRLGSKKLLYFDEQHEGYGGNMQNIEKSARKKYVADEGKLLCQNDQSGADALIVAYLMRKGNVLRELFENKVKIHNYLGVMFPETWEREFPYVRELRALPIPALKSDERWIKFAAAVAASDNNPSETRYYYHYKKAGHMLNYNAQAGTYIETLLLDSGGSVRLTKREGEVIVKGYHSLLPGLRSEFHKYVEYCYETTQTLRTLQGFPIHLTQKVFPTQYSKIYDKIPQATVAIITHQATTALQDYIEEHNLDWDLFTNTHDSYLAQAPGYLDTDNKPQGEILECAKVMQRFMEQTMTNQYGESFTMRSESQCGKNWAPYNKEKNPEGLRTV